MIRIFKLVLLLVVSQVAFGQAPSNYTNINGRYRWIAGMFDSTFHIPKGTTNSLRVGGSTNAGALFYNTTDSTVYTYTGTQWIKLRGVVIDTTSLSNRINLKLNISDTASMLAPYLRKVDTASLSNRINLKLNISDTATMLGNYLNNVGYGLIKSGQVVRADSATLATYFLRRKDSLTTTNPLGYVTRTILADTAAAIRSSTTSGFVPYTGATQNVNLGQFGLTTKFVQFDTSSQAVTDRRLQWSNDDGTLQFGMTNGSTITQRVGLEQFARVKNVQGSQINKGQVVYISGASGDRASVKLADNRADSTSSRTLGVATEDIPINDVGLVGTFGVVSNLNLAAYAPGDVLYLDSIPGGLTKSKPQAPYHIVFIGVVERANAGNGQLFTNVQNGYELEELHNVRITSPVRNNALLVYDSTRSLWIDTTIAQAGLAVTQVNTNSGSGITGGPITTVGTIAADTLVLSTRAWRQKGIDSVQANLTAGLALKLNISDTATMLSPYLRKADTTSLSNRINTKLNISDTSTMLGNYVNNVGYGLSKVSQVISADSATLASYFLRRKDSLTATNLLGYVTGKILADTAAAVRAAAGTIGGSGTTNYIPKFTSSSAIGNSQIFDNGTNVGIGTTSPSEKLEIDGSAAATSNFTALKLTNGSDGGLKIVFSNAVSSELASIVAGVTSAGAGTDDGTLIFSTAANGSSAERMRITSGGNVGIGTTSPDSTLTVQTGAWVKGGVRLSGLPTAVGTKSLRIDANGTLSIADTTTGGGIGGSGTINTLAKFTASGAIGNSSIADSSSSVRMTILSGGNIGINTTAPISKLSILESGTPVTTAGGDGASTATIEGANVAFGASYTSQLGLLSNSAMAANVGGGVAFGGKYSSANESFAYFGAIKGGKDNASTGDFGGYLSFATRANGSNIAERMRLTSGGSLGIGTTTIGSTLQVNGNAAIGYSASTAAPTNGLAVSGNLGVGIAAPTEKTEVSGTGDIKIKVSTTSTGSGANASLNLNATTEGQWILQTGNAAAGALRFYDAVAASDRMRILSNGNIAINNLGTAGSKVQINGNLAVGYSASTAAPTNGLAVSGNVGIGLSSPSTQLHIRTATVTGFSADAAYDKFIIENGNSSQGANIQLVSNSTNGVSEIGFSDATRNVGLISYGHSTNNMNFSTSSTTRFTITSGGQVTLATGANVSAIAQTGYSLTGSNASSLIDLAGTWNTTGNPTAIKLNITNTASGASSYLMDLQVGAATQFRVTKAGAIRTAAPTTGTANDWKLGTVASVTPTSPNRTIEVEVGGTIYYLHAKTTND